MSNALTNQNMDRVSGFYKYSQHVSALNLHSLMAGGGNSIPNGLRRWFQVFFIRHDVHFVSHVPI